MKISSEPSADTGPARPFSRLQRLQVLLLIALGLWSVDSGMQIGSRDVTSAALPSVSAGGRDIVHASSDPVWLDSHALATLLGRVNPHLAPRDRERIASAVLRYSAKYRLDPELVTAVLLVESTARPWVRSPKGAVGLMQVMPHMMAPLGLAGNAATIESNIEAGCWILSENIARLGEEQGISSYFWGSDIRDLGYLKKVQAARAEVRRQLAS